MTTTDRTQLVQEAATAILSASAAIQAIAGRATDLVREPYTLGRATLPLLVVAVREHQLAANRAELLIAAVADDGTTQSASQICAALLEQAETALTPSAFAAQGVEVLAGAGRRTTDSLDAPTLLALLTEGSPTLQVAELALPLIVFDGILGD